MLEKGKPVAHRVRVPIDFDMDRSDETPPGGATKPGGIVWHAPEPAAQRLHSEDCEASQGVPNPRACGIRAHELVMTDAR